MSTTPVALSTQKLKKSEVFDKLTASPEIIPKRFLKKNMSLILLPTKDGIGLLSSSPVSLKFHSASLQVNVPLASLLMICGIVSQRNDIGILGLGHSSHSFKLAL